MANLLDRIRANSPVGIPEIEAYYNRSSPASPEFMLGNWRGFPIRTGNSMVQQADMIRWAGSDFHTLDQGDPVVCYNDLGGRFVPRSWSSARLRELRFHGVISAAALYNQIPMIDIFRKVDDNTVVGTVDSLDSVYPSQGDDRFYFLLERIL